MKNSLNIEWNLIIPDIVKIKYDLFTRVNLMHVLNKRKYNKDNFCKKEQLKII